MRTESKLWVDRRLLVLLAIVALLCAAACTSQLPNGITSAGDRLDVRPDPRPDGRPEIQLIDAVPFFPQEQYQCGPAALASVLNYRGLTLTPEEIAREIYSPSARGTLNFDMLLFAQKKGMQARQYSGNIEDLKKNVDLKNPVIVLVDNGFLAYRKDHYMVVVGYDSGQLIVHSGRDRFKPVPTAEFMKSWEKTKCWTLLIEGSRSPGKGT